MADKVALVRRPSSRMTEGITTHIERVPADAGLAVRQHEA
jgi:dimethylargininase